MAKTYRVDQEYFRAFNAWGETQDYFGLWGGEKTEQALQHAREFAGEGTKIELRGRDRLNDYVGSPVWGHDRLLDTIIT
jgi:hypothetical protein